MHQPRSVLIHVGTDLVGDGLMKLTFIRAMRAAFPQAHITWLASHAPSIFGSGLAPLVAGLIDEVICAPLDSFAHQARSHGRRFDLVIDTQRRFRTAWTTRRIPCRCFISPAAGFVLSSRRFLFYRKPLALARQLMDLLRLAAGRAVTELAPLPDDPAMAEQALRLLPPGPSYVGLAPGAGGKHKCWPLERFLELGALAAAQGHQPVILLGLAEAHWVLPVRQALPQALLPLQEAPASSPLLTIALGRRLRAAVANDSGTGHMLAAADIPLVSLFGPSSPDKFAPMTRALRVVRAQDFGGTARMEAIPVAAVAEALERLLAQPH